MNRRNLAAVVFFGAFCAACKQPASDAASGQKRSDARPAQTSRPAERYSGAGFSVALPPGWSVDTVNMNVLGGTATTWLLIAPGEFGVVTGIQLTRSPEQKPANLKEIPAIMKHDGGGYGNAELARPDVHILDTGECISYLVTHRTSDTRMESDGTARELKKCVKQFYWAHCYSDDKRYFEVSQEYEPYCDRQQPPEETAGRMRTFERVVKSLDFKGGGPS